MRWLLDTRNTKDFTGIPGLTVLPIGP